MDSNAYSALDYIMNMSFEVEEMKKSVGPFAETHQRDTSRKESDFEKRNGYVE